MIGMAAILFAYFSQSPGIEAGHQKNAVFVEVLSGAYAPEGRATKLPAPILRDGMSPAEQRAVLAKAVGSGAKLEDMLRDSVTAPFVLRLKDESSGELIVRQAELLFAVRADLAEFDPAAALGGRKSGDKPEVIEAGNMRFETRLLSAEELKARGIEARGGEWYSRTKGRLLDRIAVEATDRVVSTKTNGSALLAARTTPAFEADKELPNRWAAIEHKGAEETLGRSRPYPGAAGYVKVTRLEGSNGVLFIEARFAYAEPRAWFEGAPILRSKFGLVAQDRIRSLRRELAARKGRR